MPCRDYESDNGYSQREEYKQRCDQLARIACAAMEELVKQGKEDFLVLKNLEVAEWWTAHVKADRAEKARIAEQERKDRIRSEALARLSDEEKELLGLKPKLKIKGLKSGDKFTFDSSEEEGEWGEYQKYSESDIKYLYDQLRKK